MIDLLEQEFLTSSEGLLDILLCDRTTGKNICWATEHYVDRGEGFGARDPIAKEQITGVNGCLIMPRVARSREEQGERTRLHAEVFTPSWACNAQNNLVDDSWFGRKDVFNVASEHGWKAVETPVAFPEEATWQDYVSANRLEITCGEAPYLVSRYDTVTGENIPIPERIGLLDRKLRVVTENVSGEKEWLAWARRAFESIYGYEYQGDNLLIARENLLLTFVENVRLQFSREPRLEELRDIAEVISWNAWQMDGLTMMVPYATRPVVRRQLTFLDLEVADGAEETEPMPCRIYDWQAGKSLEFRELLKQDVE